jgi:hypothetical protein
MSLSRGFRRRESVDSVLIEQIDECIYKYDLSSSMCLGGCLLFNRTCTEGPDSILIEMQHRSIGVGSLMPYRVFT